MIDKSHLIYIYYSTNVHDWRVTEMFSSENYRCILIFLEAKAYKTNNKELIDFTYNSVSTRYEVFGVVLGSSLRDKALAGDLA